MVEEVGEKSGRNNQERDTFVLLYGRFPRVYERFRILESQRGFQGQKGLEEGSRGENIIHVR